MRTRKGKSWNLKLVKLNFAQLAHWPFINSAQPFPIKRAPRGNLGSSSSANVILCLDQCKFRESIQFLREVAWIQVFDILEKMATDYTGKKEPEN